MKEQLFPFKNNVEEARAVLLDIQNKIGDEIDAKNEQENEDQAEEGIENDNEFVGRDPDIFTIPPEELGTLPEKTFY